MKDFVDWLISIDSEFASLISGADTNIVTQLQKEIGQPLPSDYRDYLLLMGENNGGLDIFVDCVSKASELLDFYRRVKRDPVPENFLPSAFALVGIYGEAVPEVFLGLSGETQNELWSGESRRPRSCFANSFRRAMYRSGFTWLQTRSKQHSCGLRRLVSASPVDSPATTWEILAAFGFSFTPYSDLYGICGIHPNSAAISAKWYSKSYVHVKLFGSEDATQDVVNSLFAQNFLLSH
jgi:hypothetical protein